MNIEVGKTYYQAGTTAHVTITGEHGDLFRGDDGRSYTKHGLYSLCKIESNSDKQARYLSQFNLLTEVSPRVGAKTVRLGLLPKKAPPTKKPASAPRKAVKDLELRIFMALCTVPELAAKLRDGHHSALQAKSIDIAKWSQQ